MKTIFWKELSGGNAVTVSDIGTDADYARDCFDGSDREWTELLDDSGEEKPHFYILSVGLRGCYMADTVEVFTDKNSAIQSAKWHIEQDDDDMAEEEVQS